MASSQLVREVNYLEIMKMSLHQKTRVLTIFISSALSSSPVDFDSIVSKSLAWIYISPSARKLSG